MGLLGKIVLAILILSFIVFCALFGSLPRLRRTPIGLINRLIWIQIPSLIVALDRLLTGGRSATFFTRASNYLMKSNHPLVLIFFLTTVLTAQTIFLPSAWPRLTRTQKVLTTILCLAPYYFTLSCAFSKASHITPSSHARHMHQYPYDHVLFHPGRWCPTCSQLKPARSKHCGVCGVCVARHDHHCIWVRNCLGAANYASFLYMLAAVGAMLGYGAWLAFEVVGREIQGSYVRRNPGLAKGTWWSEGKTWGECWAWWTWGLTVEVRLGCTGLLALFTAPLAWGLFWYHVYLVWAGTTTNESFKWEEWKEDVADGYVWKREAEEGERMVLVPEGMSAEKVEPVVDWPASSTQRLVSRANKVSMERELAPGMVLGQEPWVLVQDMAEIVNLYDLGFVENLRDVLSGG